MSEVRSSDEQRSAATRVTIRDVAAHAGVSVTTVSHALNDKGAVRAETRQRIVDSAATLGYRPNSMARGLRTSRMRVISLIMRPLDWLGEYQPLGVDYFTRLVGAAAVSALDEGYTLLLVRDPTIAGTPDIAYSVDGCIIADPERNDPVIDAMQDRGIPIVSIGQDVDRPEFVDWVGDQGDEQVNTMLDRLYAGGARKIGVLAGTQTNAWNYNSNIAVSDWSDRHLDVEFQMREVSEGEGISGGRRVAEEFLSRTGSMPDAFYAFTGRHAAGLTSTLVEAGVGVPRDVQVACGNDSEQCRASTPAISGVNLNPEGLAQEAVRLLLDRIDGGTSLPLSVSSEYFFRASTR